MRPPCFLLLTLIIILLSSLFVAFAEGTTPKYNRVTVGEEYCPYKPECMPLNAREGEIRLDFNNYPHYYHCAVIFTVPQNHKVFLHTLSEPDECIGYNVRLYDDYEIIPSNQLTPGANSYCRRTEPSRNSSDDYPRSFMTSTNYFTIQVDVKCLIKQFKPLFFNVYYQYFKREEELYQDFCHQCANGTAPFIPGTGLCENLYQNCSGLHQIKKAEGSLPGQKDKKDPSPTEIFGLLLAGAIVVAILVVAVHCGGLPSGASARGRGMVDGTGPGSGNHPFSQSRGKTKGPVVHV